MLRRGATTIHTSPQLTTYICPSSPVHQRQQHLVHHTFPSSPQLTLAPRSIVSPTLALPCPSLPFPALIKAKLCSRLTSEAWPSTQTSNPCPPVSSHLLCLKLPSAQHTLRFANTCKQCLCSTESVSAEFLRLFHHLLRGIPNTQHGSRTSFPHPTSAGQEMPQSLAMLAACLCRVGPCEPSSLQNGRLVGWTELHGRNAGR